MVEEGEGCPTMEKMRNGERGKKTLIFTNLTPFILLTRFSMSSNDRPTCRYDLDKVNVF